MEKKHAKIGIYNIIGGTGSGPQSISLWMASTGNYDDDDDTHTQQQQKSCINFGARVLTISIRNYDKQDIVSFYICEHIIMWSYV